jgi:hypothetical protein
MCDAWGSGDTTSGAVITGWVVGRERDTGMVGRHGWLSRLGDSMLLVFVSKFL